MKIETKRRIIYFIKQLLNYYEKPPYIMIEERKILTARAEIIYPKREVKLISDDQIKFGLNFRLIDELMANNAITYTQEEIEYPEGGMRARAEIRFILP